MLFFFVVVAIVNGIVFLISLPESSLLVYKCHWFWILILYPDILLNSFNRSRGVIESLGFSMYYNLSTLIVETIATTFLICLEKFQGLKQSDP